MLETLGKYIIENHRDFYDAIQYLKEINVQPIKFNLNNIYSNILHQIKYTGNRIKSISFFYVQNLMLKNKKDLYYKTKNSNKLKLNNKYISKY